MSSDDRHRRERLEQVFDAHEGQLRAYATRRLESRADVEDVVSETFAIAWRRLDDLPDEPLPWLYGTARRVIANHHRGTRRRTALAQAAADAVRTRGDGDETGILEALAALSEPDREALLLVAWEGLSHRRAAQALGCSTPAFAARHRRARMRLAKRLWGRSGVRPGPDPASRFDDPRKEAP